jgi:UDP-glucose:(heptosyl)LPS alpha-1,3-glucosyltransferase
MITPGSKCSSITLVAQSVDDSTGLGRIASALAGEYITTGHEVHIVSQQCIATPGSWHRVPSFALTPALGKIAFRLFEPSRSRSVHDSIIHAFGVGAEADFVAAQSCHKAAVKLQRIRGTNRIANRNWGLYDRLSVGDERRLFTSPRLKRIVAVSQLVREQILEEYRIPGEAVCVIPNGVHLSRFPKQGKSETPSRSFVLLFVGNEFDRKGLQTAIEALPLLSEFPLELHVAGSDDPAPYAQRARELKVIDRVKFLGSVAAPESLFTQADAFVFPTYYEPFGMVIIEAMAAGIPVITTRAAGAVEGLTDGVHGLYVDDPCSAEEVAGRLRMLLNDAGLRRSLSANGLTAAQSYGWPVIAARYLELYRIMGS